MILNLDTNINKIKLEKNEKIIFRPFTHNFIKYEEKNDILIYSYYNENTKTFIIYYNLQKNNFQNNNYSFYCFNCQETFDKDESLYHKLVTKHKGLIQKEIKCLKHNKNFIFFNPEKEILLCEKCINNNNNIDFFSLLYKPQTIIYKNGNLYNGLLNNNKREGYGNFIYSNNTIYIGSFKDDNELLPAFYINKNKELIYISDKWGEYINFFNFEKCKDNFITIFSYVLDTLKLNHMFTLNEIEMKIFFFHHSDKLTTYNVCFHNIVFDKNRHNLILFLGLTKIIAQLNDYIRVNYYGMIKYFIFLPSMKKDYFYDLKNFHFSEIINIYNSKDVIIDNSDKLKLLFCFTNIDTYKVIEIHKNLDYFNQNNNFILNDMIIYFIFYERTVANKNEIINEYFKLNSKIKIKYLFYTFNLESLYMNIFWFTKYNKTNYFIILKGKYYHILQMGLLNSFERKIVEFKFPSNKIINFIKVKKELLNLNKKIQSNISYYAKLIIKVPLRLRLNDQNKWEPLKKAKLKLIGSLRENEYKKYKDKIINIIPEKYININILETFTFDIKNIQKYCFNCKKIINDNKEIYHCLWCNITFCEKCTENKFNNENNKGLNKLIHKEHNLLYFKTRNQKNFLNLDKYKLGNNLFNSIPEEKLSLIHKLICSICNKNNLKSPRYICLNCRPGEKFDNGFYDYCFECIQHMKNNDKIGIKYQLIEDEKVKELNSPFIELCHKHDYHIYLFILYNSSNDYYSY